MLENPSGFVPRGCEALGDIESAERGHPFDQGSFDAAHAGQFELRLRSVARQLDAAFEQANPGPGTPDLSSKNRNSVKRQEPLKLLSGALFLVHCPCMKMACVL